jgi:hypothetical protein
LENNNENSFIKDEIHCVAKTIQKLLKINNSDFNNKFYNEIKIHSISEKELEIQNQRFYEIQAFIEANKQKIEQVERYDDLMKENLELRQENEKLKKSSEYLKDNKNIKDLLVRKIIYYKCIFNKRYFFIKFFQRNYYN